MGDPGLVADCLRNLAWAEAMLSQCDAALDHVLRAQALYDQTGDVPGQAAALNILATAHLNMDSYGNSLKAALQSLAMYEQSLPGQSRVEIYGNIGIAYLEDWEKATEYMQRGLKEARAHKDAIGELDHLNSLGYTCFLQGDYAHALAYCEQALALARRHGARHQLAYILHSLGETLGVSGDLDRALACFEEGLAARRAIDHNSYAAANLRGIAGVLRQQGHLDAALASLQQALAVAGQQSSPREIALIHQQLAAFYEQQGDLSQALAHHRQFYALQKDLLSIRADQRVKGLQTLHDLELARVEADSEREKNRILHQQLALHEQHISDLDFYAHTVAHDLRNPISIVIGFSTMLLEELKSKLDPDQLQGLNLIFETGRKMEQIVEELLMLATHQEQGVLHQPVAMEHVFKEALHRLEIMTAKHEASIRLVTPLPPVRGHPAWLEEVWVNYLSNAIKYGGCPPGWRSPRSGPATAACASGCTTTGTGSSRPSSLACFRKACACLASTGTATGWACQSCAASSSGWVARSAWKAAASRAQARPFSSPCRWRTYRPTATRPSPASRASCSPGILRSAVQQSNETRQQNHHVYREIGQKMQEPGPAHAARLDHALGEEPATDGG